MNKENVLFGIIGLLLGCVIGFMYANSVNQSGPSRPAPVAGMPSNTAIPPGHPDIGASNSGMQPAVQEAIAKARAAPDDFEAQIKAAEMYYQIQRFDGAIEFLKRAGQLKPDDYETTVNLGNAYFDAQKYEEAEKSYSAALAKKADDVNVRTDLGLTFVFRGSPNYDHAIQEFQRSLDLDPNHIQTLQNLTVAYTKKGDSAKAKAILARLEGLDSTNSAIAKLRDDLQKIDSK
jgi:tetratricopeptide (TPR) repeat protein